MLVSSMDVALVELILSGINNKDVEHAEYILKNYKSAYKMIITDGVFSMDGDIAPLDRLYELSKEYDALLMVDDAHATGVIGNGRGTAHHLVLPM